MLTSVPHMHQKNGCAERFICTAMDKAQAMHLDACFTQNWWEFTVDCTTHVYNHITIQCHDWKMPFENLKRTKPDVTHLCVFGCGTYVFLLEEVRVNKLNLKSELMTFLGYPQGTKGYLLMRGPNNVLSTAVQALFDETLLPKCPDMCHPGYTPVYHVNSPNDAFWCHFGLWYVYFILFYFFIYSLYQLRVMQCHVHGPNDAFCASFRPICSKFFCSFSNFTTTTTILPPQVKATQHNSDLYQTPPTPCALCHVHGLNNAQNTSFRPVVFFLFLFIFLLLTNVLPCQVSKTQPNNDPHQPPPTPRTLLCPTYSVVLRTDSQISNLADITLQK